MLIETKIIFCSNYFFHQVRSQLKSVEIKLFKVSIKWSVTSGFNIFAEIK